MKNDIIDHIREMAIGLSRMANEQDEKDLAHVMAIASLEATKILGRSNRAGPTCVTTLKN